MARLSEQEEVALRDLLGTLNSYYARRNLDILEKFRDFDRNNIGVLTISQFVRTMDEPVLKQSEMDLLCRKFHHPERKGFINYLNFYNDVKSNPDVFKNSLQTPNGPTYFRGVSPKTFIFICTNNHYNNHMIVNAFKEDGLSEQDIIDKISVASYKFGIRVHDFFKDMDPLRSGLVTDRQFITACSNGLLKPANLCPEDVSQLAEYFRQGNGRVDYKTFCDTVENVFTVPGNYILNTREFFF